MAHMIPESMLEFDPQGREDLVFNALKTGLGDGYWVFHSCSVNQTGRDGAFYEKEIDFVGICSSCNRIYLESSWI